MRVVAAFLVNTLCNFAIGLLVAKFLGPEEFGRFALTLAVAMAMQTGMFEWIRQSTIRFYSERSRVSRPELRATLDVSFAIIAATATALAIGFMLSGFELALSNGLIGLAVAASITNGVFDYTTAIVRARFDDGLYSRLVLTKNVLALVCTAGGALVFHSAAWALGGVCISMAGSIFTFRASLSDGGARSSLAHRGIAMQAFRYASPIVVANLLYLLIPLANRSLMASWYGYAETGQFSLAFDIGSRVVAAIGSALDVLLFQMAVRADELHGVEHGRDQVARNMAVLYALMAPACAGVWLTLPSIEKLVVPSEFRGPFLDYFGLLLSGHFVSGLLWFGVNPIFQIAKRTRPMIVGALCAWVADIVLVATLPDSPFSLAIAQSGAMTVGFTTLIIYAAAIGARFPAGRDLLAATFGAGAMVVALLPLRGAEPGVATLTLQVVCGLTIYAAFVVVFDIAGLRAVGQGVARSLRARFA